MYLYLYYTSTYCTLHIVILQDKMHTCTFRDCDLFGTENTSVSYVYSYALYWGYVCIVWRLKCTCTIHTLTCSAIR